MTFDEALGLARLLIDYGIVRETAIHNSAIPEEYRPELLARLEREEAITLEPVRVLSSDGADSEWLLAADRSKWYYWPTLREYLLSKRGWSLATTRSLDEATDRILEQLAEPYRNGFDIRGLVIGYVQSGKTANYSALIAKAADVGYRLVVVLSGIDNGLRRQTQVRLQKELVGPSSTNTNSVQLPPPGLQWHLFTSDLLEGDFRPGFANQAALQGAQPVLLVVKKNGAVLKKLLRWLREAPSEVRQNLPFMLIDDEADQASIDTRGDYVSEGEDFNDENEDPSPINSYIRELLSVFQRSAYVAYTATPFANILIPHDTFHPEVRNDLYPKNFIIDLPKPNGYFGADELFGFEGATSQGSNSDGLNVLREVTDLDLAELDAGRIPNALRMALEDFVLAGAARALRGQGDHPATMLIHISQLRAEQHLIASLVQEAFSEVRDQWRYHRDSGVYERLRTRWNSFRLVTRSLHPLLDKPFEDLENHIGPFFEAVQVRTLNMDTGEVLDYEREPRLKAIAIGGNKLSRGLTLEGLLTSFFVRRSVMYDTLMQMGRWFGFREGYEDLTRLYTTSELQDWFADLAFVERRLREDLEIYERRGLTPLEVGMRIWQHPTMEVTSRLKRRHASQIMISQSYSEQVVQTVKFPLRNPEKLAVAAERNRLQVIDFLKRLGQPNSDPDFPEIPIWKVVRPQIIIEFLRSFSLDSVRSVSPELLCAYIEKSLTFNELTKWTVAIRGRGSFDDKLGIADWGVPDWEIRQINRSRRRKFSEEIVALTSAGDEMIGLDRELREEIERRAQEAKKSVNPIARECRSPEEGLLLLYPISKFSGPSNVKADGTGLQNIYIDPSSGEARDLVGYAVSFPKSNSPHPVEAYMEGSVGWQVVE